VTVEDASGGRVVIDGDGIPRTAKSSEPWDGETVVSRVLKSEAERRFTLLCAYPADRADRAIAADNHRDFASKDSVELAAWDYMRKHRKIGLGHQDHTEGSGDLVESGIYRGPDWRFAAADGSEQLIKAGDWLIGVIWAPEVWKGFRSGDLNGGSMQGGAVRRTPSKESLARLRD
jgi:hypothetical protein